MSARVATLLRVQAAACAGADGLRSPLYAELLAAAADDLEAGGPTAAVLAGCEDAPAGSALALRLMAALHRLVLERRAPGLALHFPTVGGTAPPRGAWAAARRVLAEHPAEVRRLVTHPCQTNEVGRSAVLLAGLLQVSRRAGLPVRLLEVGSSAGLNLRFDAYRYDAPGGRWGPSASAVHFADPWAGETPDLGVGLSVVARAGCDIAPLDPATAEGRLRLSSSVWGTRWSASTGCAVRSRSPHGCPSRWSRPRPPSGSSGGWHTLSAAW